MNPSFGRCCITACSPLKKRTAVPRCRTPPRDSPLRKAGAASAIPDLLRMMERSSLLWRSLAPRPTPTNLTRLRRSCTGGETGAPRLASARLLSDHGPRKSRPLESRSASGLQTVVALYRGFGFTGVTTARRCRDAQTDIRIAWVVAANARFFRAKIRSTKTRIAANEYTLANLVFSGRT